MDRFGPYAVIEHIATGGMGEVYRAKRLGAGGFEKEVALKTVRPELAGTAELVQQLIDEAKLAAWLTHGNIAQVLDLVEVSGQWAVVCELVQGVDLFALERTLEQHERRLGLDECVHIVKEVLFALDFVHRATDADGRPLHLVHHDIAPANVMVNVGGEVKLIDFGLTRGPSLWDVEGRVPGGKIRYRAPEQLQGDGFDQRSDLYAAGVILWELLAGERIFESMSLEEIMSAVAEADIPPVGSIRSDVPDALDAVVARAVHPDPRGRYPTAAAFLEALDALPLGGNPARSRHVLAEIVTAIALGKGGPGRPAPSPVEVAEDVSLEDSLESALDAELSAGSGG